MSIVSSIRDYIEIINTSVETQKSSVSLFSAAFNGFPQILETCKNVLWYFFSFQYLRDNFYHPYLSLLNNNSPPILIDSIYDKGLEPSNNIKFFLYGLGNSFFFSLPGSVGTLLILRRIILEGIPAGLAATVGSVLGTCLISVSVTFGSRILVLSPAFLDLLFYIGLLIPGFVILRGLCFSDYRIITIKDRKALTLIGVMHFFLGMSNQSTLFKHIRDLTIIPFPTRFFGISDKSLALFYTLGFSFGSICFALILFYSLVFFINWGLTQLTITRSRLMKLSENLSIILLTGLSISTFSYYGTDFLLTKGLGFLPSDKSFAETALAPASLFKDPHNLTGVHALYPSNEFSLDPAPFDQPLEKYFRRSILLKQPFFKYRSFEELNYQGEKHWLHRGFRHGSAKPIKTVTLPAEKNKLSEARTLLRSLDKAIGWVDENNTKSKNPLYTFTNLAKEDILNFEYDQLKNTNSKNGFNDIGFLEQKFKRLFFGQIGLLPGRLPPVPSGPFDSQEMAHKRLAFTNPVYKALLSFDIDLFLKRQPSTQFLSTEDEHNIFLKRQLLERYINTQRDYFDDESNSLILNSKNFNSNKKDEELNKAQSLAQRTSRSFSEKPFLFNKEIMPFGQGRDLGSETFGLSPVAKTAGLRPSKTKDITLSPLSFQLSQGNLNISNLPFFTKSLANQTYKHQFKGTLEIVRQMFAVSLDCPEPSSVAGGGASDKIFTSLQNKPSNSNNYGNNFFDDDKGIVIPRPLNPRILKYDQPLYIGIKQNPDKNLKGTVKGPLLSSQGLDQKSGLDLTQKVLASSGSTGFDLGQDQRSSPEGHGPMDPDPMGLDLRSATGERPKVSDQRSRPAVLAFEHEELYNSFNKERLFESPKKQKPFLEAISISPFYVGWDHERRQLLLTQRYLSRKDALIFKKPKVEVKYIKENQDKIKGRKLKLLDQDSYNATFASWPLLKPDLLEKPLMNWKIPSHSFEQMVSLEEESRLGLDEPSDKSKGLRGSYDIFLDLWNKNFLRELPQQIPSFKLIRWPNNITTPSVQGDLDSFDPIETSLFTGVKRGGFVWPGGTLKK